MILHEFQGAFVLDKPSGVSTHTPDGGITEGFLEMASRLLERDLWAVHRLDRDTSGCLLVTTSASAVDRWSQSLTEGKKKYIFVSRENTTQSVWSYEGHIEKTGSHRFGLVQGSPNSFTTFGKLGECGLGYLYEAEISSGKTHQIRIHAQASGIPILGDEEYGGGKFFRLMLHAKELELDGHKVVSPPPRIFEVSKERVSYFEDICKFLVSLDRRRFLMNYLKDVTDSFRLVHREWTLDSKPRLCVEKLGDVLQVLSYAPKPLHDQFLRELAGYVGCREWFVREMFDRGKSETKPTNISNASANLPLQWYIKESKMKFDMRYQQGMSSGIFLDQRVNRNRVLHHSQGKKVANFFSYTCGFSVAAALGGAHEVVSVDTSATSLEWGKNNFRVNGLDPDKYEFFVADALFFLRSALKRGRRFDLIILDPPTFSRSKQGSFRLSENLPELLDLAFQCVAPSGSCVVTVNDESVSFEDLSREIEMSVDRTLKRMVKMERVIPPYDFEFPLERHSVTKGFWVTC